MCFSESPNLISDGKQRVFRFFFVLAYSVPDEWATTKCSIVHKFCSDHWNEINIVHIATISNSQIT